MLLYTNTGHTDNAHYSAIVKKGGELPLNIFENIYSYNTK